MLLSIAIIAYSNDMAAVASTVDCWYWHLSYSMAVIVQAAMYSGNTSPAVIG